MEPKSEKDYTFVPKGWGSEMWIVNNEEYCGKLLHFDAGKRLSWHYHELKRETFWVLKGKVTLKYAEHDRLEDAEEVTLSQGMSFEIPRGLRHQVIAQEDSDIIEFSTTHYDSDSFRIKKGD